MRDGLRKELIGVKKELLEEKERNYAWFKVLANCKYCPGLKLQELLQDDDDLIDISFYFAPNLYRHQDTEQPGLDRDEQATIDSIYNFIKNDNPDFTEMDIANSLRRQLIQLDTEKGFI